jgi:pantoate--beta-alanine ligase
VSVNRAPKFNAGELNVYSNPSDVGEVSRALRHTGRRVMLVPTMGALHNGHLALVRAAKRVPGSVVVVSIFVNPLQFGADEDLAAYPRIVEDDLALLRGEGVEIAFAPSVAAMYPDGPRTAVHPGPLGSELEGATRPTHFAGMLTVVLKLLQIVRPDRVFFGEKDYQQLVLVRQMVADLNVAVRVIGVPIVRETDGLAMSSRNRYLNAAQRELAGVLSAALLAGTYAAARGADAALQAAGAVLAEVPAIDVDYLEVRDSALGSAPTSGAGRLLVAARLGKTRLLDNVAIEIGTTVGVDGRVPAVSAEYRPATMRAVKRPEMGALPREREVPPPACGGERGNRVLETPWRN